LQQGVVVDGYLVEIFDAPGAILVAYRVGTGEEEQVRRRASQRRDPRNNDGPRPLFDYYLFDSETRANSELTLIYVTRYGDTDTGIRIRRYGKTAF
jgi:hypothetical protein